MVQLLSFDTAFRPASQGIFLGKRIRTSPEALDFTGVSRLVLIIGYWHTSATLLIQQGIDLKTVQNRLGHTDPSMIMQRYGHVTKTMASRAVTELEDAIYGGRKIQ